MLQEILNLLSNHEGYRFHRGTFTRETFSADPEKKLSAGKCLKDSTTVSAGVNGNLFIKRYNRKGVWRTLKRIVQVPRSYRCLAASIALRQAGIATPEVKLASKYYLITEALPESTRYLNFYPELLENFLPVMLKMHDAGIFHGDLSMRNIYFLEGHYGLIDLDSERLYPGGVPTDLRRKELARVISSCAKVQRKAFSGEELKQLAERICRLYGFTDPGDPAQEKLLRRTEYLFRRKR